MRPQRCTLAVVLVLGAAAWTACSAPPATDSSTSVAPSTSTTTSAATTTSTVSQSTTTLSTAAAVNVPVTDQIRAQLVAAGAALNGIPATQYSGLAPGLTFYAYDKTTSTYWAGARLVPAPVATSAPPSQAQISSQDDGSYYLFTRPSGGTWKVYPAGATGPPNTCPLTVPDAVLQVWGWAAGSCRPAGA
jgi:hypothetical protein